MNKFCASGNLTREPELRVLQSGKTVCNFGMAIKSKFAKDAEPLFINCQAWGQTAKYTADYLHKGDTAGIESHLDSNNYTDKNGSQHHEIIAVVDNIEFIRSPKSREQNGASDNNAIYTSLGGVPNDDELPF